MSEKGFLQTGTCILQKAFFRHALRGKILFWGGGNCGCGSGVKVVPEFVAEDCVGSTEDVSSDTEGQGVGKTEEGGGDGEGTKGVENGLPWIACRVANADSADHSDVGIHVFREQEIENQKNSASDDVI